MVEGGREQEAVLAREDVMIPMEFWFNLSKILLQLLVAFNTEDRKCGNTLTLRENLMSDQSASLPGFFGRRKILRVPFISFF